MSDVIVNITNALVKAAGSQAAARDAINTAENDIKMANDTLSKVRNDNTELTAMLQGTICNDDFQCITALQHCYDIVSICYNIVPTLLS